MENTALAPAVFAPAARDRITIYVAAIAAIALCVLPWATVGGASALLRAIGGAVDMWALVAGTAAALFFSWREMDRATAFVAGASVVWAFASALAAGPAGPSFGWGAAIALPALTV